MKKILILFVALILNCNTVFASDNFFNPDWWKIATVEDVKTEIANGADVNAKDKDGWTALTIAARMNKNPEFIKNLIDAGADVNNSFIDVVEAVQNSEVIRVMLNAGADVNAKDELGFTALISAVSNNGNPEIIQMLINAGADVNAKSFGWTVLMYAVINNANPEIIQMLIGAGADVNAVDDKGFTALTIAARMNKNPEIIKALIDAGADVNAKLDNGSTALDFAKHNSASPEIAGKDANFFSPIWWKTATVEDVKAEIANGADVNAKDKYGLTALTYAAVNNQNPEIVKALIDAGADVNAKNDKGLTVLMSATENNRNPEVIKVLLDAGADVNAEIEKERLTVSPLGMAIERYSNENDKNNENYKIIELLINAGADVNAKLKTNDKFLKAEGPLLAFVIADKDNRIIEKLINSGADVNIQSGTILNKTSLLMTATKLKNIKKIKLLIDAGADVNAYSEGLWGCTALMSAVLSQNQEIIKMLIDAGADVNAKSIARDIDEDELFKNLYIPSEIPESERLEYKIKAKEFVNELREVSPNKEFIGATPLMIAARKANPEIIKILIDAGADTSLKSADNKTALDIAKEKNGNPEVIEILEHHQEFDEMFAECYSTQNIGNYANKFCKCAIKSAIDALGPADKEKAKDAFDDARAGTFKNLIQKGKSAAFNECY